MAGIGDLANNATAALRKQSGKQDVTVTPAITKAVFNSLIELVMKGEVVSVQGLGNFRMVDRRATKARNPKTGETFDVPATTRVKFTASKTLRDSLPDSTPEAPGAAAEVPVPAAATK